MRGAKYSVVLGGHYSVHAVFKCATNSANTTILGHIRITNTQKLGSCLSTQGWLARIEFRQAAQLHRASKQVSTCQVYNWGKAIEIKQDWAYGQSNDLQIIFLFFLFCIIYSKGAPAPVTQWGSADAAKRISRLKTGGWLTNSGIFLLNVSRTN